MRKRAILISVLLGISLSIVSGCSKKEVVKPAQSDVMEETAVEEKELYSEKVEDESEDGDSEAEELHHESKNPSTVLEDEEAVYFCGEQHILKWDKQTQATDVIWMTDKKEIIECAYAYRNMPGILIEDKIYFIQSWLKEPMNPLASETLYALSVVNTDGSEYKEIEEVKGLNRLLLLDGILYFSYDVDSGALEGYVVDGDGELQIDKGKVVTEPVNVPADYSEMSYNNNGTQFLTAIESAYRYGYYLLRDENYELCIVNQNTGEKEVLPEEYKNYTLISRNQNYFLMKDYSENKIYLLDTQTRECDILIESDYDTSVFGMDYNYVYWMRF